MTESKTALVPVTEGDARRDALLRALGFDRLNEGQRELALSITTRYDLDPMLRHVVMIDGKPYITRDGLLHVAHKSGDFDGIEVDPPTNDGEYWRTTARVYRKSFSRPFSYPGRYPAKGGNNRYNEEMAIKVAEVMTLRRAFDVSAPVIEERWDGDFEDAQATPPPTSLAERVATRALASQNRPEQPETGASSAPDVADAGASASPAISVPEEDPEDEPEDEADENGDIPPRYAEPGELDDEDEEDEPVEEGLFTAPTGGFTGPDVHVSPLRGETLEPQQAPTDDSDPLDLFKAWARDHDMNLIKATARSLFPSLTGFKELNAKELAVIQHEVVKAEIAAQQGTAVPHCDAVNPMTGNRCTLDPGHKSAHRHGTREAWNPTPTPAAS